MISIYPCHDQTWNTFLNTWPESQVRSECSVVVLDIWKGLVVENDCLELDITLIISKQHTLAFGNIERQHVI